VLRIGKINKMYEQNPQTRRHLSQEKSEETSATRSMIRSKSQSKYNITPIPIAGNNNEITEIIKMLEKMQARTNESDKRMKTMATALQDHNKEPHSKEVEDEEGEEDRGGDLEAVKRERGRKKALL